MTRTRDLDVDEASIGEFAERKPDAQLEYSCGTLIESCRLTSSGVENENLIVHRLDYKTFTS